MDGISVFFKKEKCIFFFCIKKRNILLHLKKQIPEKHIILHVFKHIKINNLLPLFKEYPFCALTHQNKAFGVNFK